MMLDRFFEKMVPDVFQESEQFTKDTVNLLKAKTEEHVYNQTRHKEAADRLDLVEKHIEELSRTIAELDRKLQEIEKVVNEMKH